MHSTKDRIRILFPRVRLVREKNRDENSIFSSQEAFVKLEIQESLSSSYPLCMPGFDLPLKPSTSDQMEHANPFQVAPAHPEDLSLLHPVNNSVFVVIYTPMKK
jgi:hypothetical protein